MASWEDVVDEIYKIDQDYSLRRVGLVWSRFGQCFPLLLSTGLCYCHPERLGIQGILGTRGKILPLHQSAVRDRVQ